MSDMSEAEASATVDSLFRDVVDGKDGAIPAFQYLVQRTSFLPEDRNFVNAFIQWLKNDQLCPELKYAFFQAFQDRNPEPLRTLHVRTQEILPEGQSVMDMYRDFIRGIVHVRNIITKGRDKNGKGGKKGRKA